MGDFVTLAEKQTEPQNREERSGRTIKRGKCQVCLENPPQNDMVESKLGIQADRYSELCEYNLENYRSLFRQYSRFPPNGETETHTTSSYSRELRLSTSLDLMNFQNKDKNCNPMQTL